MTKHREILNFITLIRESHPLMIKIYTNGSCLNFYLILRKLWPEAVPYFNIDHILTKIDDKFYDITGEIIDLDIYGCHINTYQPYREYYNNKGMSRSFKQMYNANYKICSK